MLATEITNFNGEEKDLQGETPITDEHVQNNRTVREMLEQRGINLVNYLANLMNKKEQNLMKHYGHDRKTIKIIKFYGLRRKT